MYFLYFLLNSTPNLAQITLLYIIHSILWVFIVVFNFVDMFRHPPFDFLFPETNNSLSLKLLGTKNMLFSLYSFSAAFFLFYYEVIDFCLACLFDCVSPSMQLWESLLTETLLELLFLEGILGLRGRLGHS